MWGLLHIQAKKSYKRYKLPNPDFIPRAVIPFEWSVNYMRVTQRLRFAKSASYSALFHFSFFEENTNQKMAGRNQDGKNQTKDLKYGTHLLSDKLRNMSEDKKELTNSFKLGKNILETGYGSFKVRPKTIGAALGINASGDLFPQKVNYKDLSEDEKQIFRRFQGKTLKNLTDEMMAIGVDNEQDRLMFKRIFILYIQMAFLLPTTINKISPVHLAPTFKMDTITERNWGAHVLNFIIKGITDYNLQKKKAIDGCLFALMIVYFHLSKNKDKKRAERPPEPWIANWTREQLVERMRTEIEEHMASSSSSSETETTESEVHSTSESESEEDSEDSTRKQPTQKAKKMESKKRKKIQEDSDSESESNDESEIGTEELDEFLRENNEKSAAQGEKEVDLRSTEGHYILSETIPDINLGSDDPSSQGHTDQSSVNKPAESMLSLVVESASEPAEENMMVVKQETQSKALAIVSIQVYLPLSQTTTVPEIKQTPVTENEPTPVLQIEGTIKSLGLTDSSQEKAATQEGASTQDGERVKTPKIPKLLEQLGDLVQKITSGEVTTKEKSPQIRKKSGGESFEKFETPTRTNEDTSDMKEKCYLWAIRVKTYANGLTNEFDTVCTLQAQDRYILSKLHLASLAAETHIEAENMAIVNHPKGVFLRPKTNKPFRVEDYPIICWGAPLKTRDKDKEIVPPYLHISGQKTSYDCAIYVMKWLEIFQPANIKRLKYEWDNWTQLNDEVDHFRVEYASRILFHEMNQDKAKAIRGSNAIRLSKLSSLLLSPYCQIDSKNIDTD
ncbi:hypothetical protein Ahy_A07g034847 [Arachis hypogaea]|uniref:Ubiquitin-like protease family profile domain-containing protein n=1 Tax=Arachis hypogaea TaxID=3818 RepID=A0A445CCU8_ARAHY|nr:hypothetical protein Ahy_A07g034847 [Arachis hypogaea]